MTELRLLGEVIVTGALSLTHSHFTTVAQQRKSGYERRSQQNVF